MLTTPPSSSPQPPSRNLQAFAQSELTNLISYFHANNLVPNPTKTVYSILHPRKPPAIQLTIGDKPFNRDPKAKLLGFIVQDNMKYHQAISNIVKKLQPHMQSFKYANKLLSLKTMKQQYYSHVYPHLISNISIWGSSNPKKPHLQPFIKTQKKIIRLVSNVPPRSHTRPIMARLQILNISNLYILRTTTEMHPFIHPPKKQLNRPEHNHEYTPVSKIHNHRTRYSLKKHQFIPHAKHYSKSREPTLTMEHFPRQHAAVWNSLPAHLRDIKSKTTFKTETKQHLLNKQSQHEN
jgi:hypothetical protein